MLNTRGGSFDSIILILGKMVQIAVAFLALRTMTSLLSEEEVARYYTLLSVFTLLNFAFLNGPGQFYNRKIVKLRDSGKLFSGTMVLLMARLVLTILALLTCFLIYYLFSFDAFFTIEAFFACCFGHACFWNFFSFN